MHILFILFLIGTTQKKLGITRSIAKSQGSFSQRTLTATRLRSRPWCQCVNRALPLLPCCVWWGLPQNWRPLLLRSTHNMPSCCEWNPSPSILSATRVAAICRLLELANALQACQVAPIRGSLWKSRNSDLWFNRKTMKRHDLPVSSRWQCSPCAKWKRRRWHALCCCAECVLPCALCLNKCWYFEYIHLYVIYVCIYVYI